MKHSIISGGGMTENSLFHALSADSVFDLCMRKYYARIEENKKLYNGPNKTTYKAGDRVICLAGIDEKRMDIEEYETKVIAAHTRDIMTDEPRHGTGPAGTYFITSEDGCFCQTQDCMLRPASPAGGTISKESEKAALLYMNKLRKANELLRHGIIGVSGKPGARPVVIEDIAL